MSENMLGESARCNTPNEIPRRNKTRNWLDVLINVILMLVGLAMLLVYLLPIFSNTLYTPQGNYNFGKVHTGETIRHDFVIRNIHPWPVTIASVIASCGCTTGTIGETIPYRLNPMQSVRLKAMVDTTHKEGEIEQIIYINTSEDKVSDKSSHTQLVLHGTVLQASTPRTEWKP